MRRPNLPPVYCLDVGDGLKETRALSKPSRSSSLLYASTTFKEVFKSEFEAIPAAVNTRWKSTLRQVQALIECDHPVVCGACF